MALKSGTSDRRQQCVVNRRPNQLSSTCQAVVPPRRDEDGSTLNPLTLRTLLDNFFKLTAEDVDLATHQIAAKCNVQPVSLLALHHEFVRLGNIGRVRSISPSLRDNIDH